MALWVFLIVISIITLGVQNTSPKCPKSHSCVRLRQCNSTENDAFLYPCHSGLNMVCCPNFSSPENTTLVTRETALFPVNCGLVMTSDKVSGGKKADLGQFPWMALLGYRQRGIDYTQFLCGGSVITENYILTAAHCINLDRRLELVVVRLGEHDLLADQDCLKVGNFQTCADPHVDFKIQDIQIHPDYNSDNLQNDIALVRIRPSVKFSDFIKPICLPFERKLDKLDKQKLTISGWGKTSASNLGGSTTLQFAVVTVWNQSNCSKNVPPEVQPITESQLCANGPVKEDACKGDSGGPLVNATIDSGGDLRYFQVGIVSFASTLTCGDPNLPTVYTRVDKYLKWIEKTIF